MSLISESARGIGAVFAWLLVQEGALIVAEDAPEKEGRETETE